MEKQLLSQWNEINDLIENLWGIALENKEAQYKIDLLMQLRNGFNKLIQMNENQK